MRPGRSSDRFHARPGSGLVQRSECRPQRHDIKADPALLDARVRYEADGPGNSADYSANAQVLRTTFNFPG